MNKGNVVFVLVIVFAATYTLGTYVMPNSVFGNVARFVNGDSVSTMEPVSAMPVESFPADGFSPSTFSGVSGIDFGVTASKVVGSVSEQARLVGQMQPLQAVENPFSASVTDWVVFLVFSFFAIWFFALLVSRGVKKGQELGNTVKNGISLKTFLLLIVVAVSGLLGYVEYEGSGIIGLAQYSGLIMAAIMFIVFAMNFSKVTQTIGTVVSGIVLLVGIFFLPVIGVGLLVPYADSAYVAEIEGMSPALVQLVFSVARENPIWALVLGLAPFMLWFLYNREFDQGGE